MTYREFKTLVCKVSQEQLQSRQNHPILFGIERAQFEKQKLQRMIDAGNQLRSKTAQRRIEAWQREINRLDEKGKYLQEQYQESHRSPAFSQRLARA